LWKVSAEGTTLWAIRAGGTSNDELYGVAVDSAGASVAAGSFSSSPAMFEGVNLTNVGSYDAVVWKVFNTMQPPSPPPLPSPPPSPPSPPPPLSESLVTSFAVNGGGTGYEYMQAVAIDGTGGVVAAGYFSSSGATFGGVTLTNAGSDDAVLWKMNAEGTTLWAVRGGGTSSDQLYGVAVDGAGGVVAAGYFSSSTATFEGVALSSSGSNDAVLWKLNAEGTMLWAVRGGGTSTDRLYGVAVDNSNAVVAAGRFSSNPATFGDVALARTGYGAAAVVWKVSAEGTTLWAVRGGGTDSAYLKAVAVDGMGAVVAAGDFGGATVTFGGVALTNNGSSYSPDVVVWKLSGEGTTLWAVRGGGTSYDYLYGVAVDDAGAVVAAGYFSSSSAMFGGEALTKAGGEDAILWKMNSEGTTMWGRGGGDGYETLQGVAVDGANDVVATGYFNSLVATFGGDVLTNAGSSGSKDGLLWKVSAEVGPDKRCPPRHSPHFRPSLLEFNGTT